MKAILHLVFLLLLAAPVSLLSCKKDHSCEGCREGNRPPIANAGKDTLIFLPSDSATLNGTLSTDPDGNISEYQWSKVSGPSTHTLSQPAKATTSVKSLTAGTYLFELTVKDNGGLSAKDTVQVMVNAAPTAPACDNSNRPQVTAQLIPVGTLSEKREGIAVASAGGKILFAGGYQPGQPWPPTSRVDIYDATTNTWSTAQLSLPRSFLATAVLGSKVFFAGGYAGGSPSSRVDIYDAVTGTWTTKDLSIARQRMAAAAAGNKVLFAGGSSGFFKYSHQVDIYDGSNGTWAASSLSNRTPTGTVGMSATAIGNKIYIAGEASDADAWDHGSFSSTINIYDVTTNTWSLSDLSIPRGYMAAIAVGSKIYWAGGMSKQPPDPLTSLVEIRDVNSGLSTFSCLSLPNGEFSAAQKNNQIVFFTSQFDWHPAYFTVSPPAFNRFDILNLTNNTWAIGVLPVNIIGASIISVNNNIYVAGGYVNGVLSNQVWRLEF